MKKRNLAAAIFGLIFFLSYLTPVIAYNQKEIDRLLATNTCLKCDLYRARLSKIDLTNANLSGSNLISANLQKATLYGAKIDGVNFLNANLEGAMWVDGSICQKGSIGRCVQKED